MRNHLKIFLTFLLVLFSTTSFAQRPTVGGQAQDFTLVNGSGEVISLSDLHGTPVVLNFWATWCVPCREELPFFQTTYDQINNTATPVIETTEVANEAMTENAPTNSETNSETDSANELDTIVDISELAEKKLHFVIVNNNEDGQKATDFLEEISINLTSLIDASKDERATLEGAGTELDKTLDVVKSYRVRGMPTTFYIDADGVIQVIKQGLISPQSMQEDLAKIGIEWEPVIEDSNDS